ncbi:MAG: hypothetical protein ACRD3Q_03725 [Terriglobales bacterium]
MKRIVMVVGIAIVLPMLGCSPLENQARDTAAALAGSIVAAQSEYLANCTANPGQEVCELINRGISGQNALISAVETYCGWETTMPPPDPQATCVPVKSAQQALEIAIANAASLTVEIKGAL